MRVLATLGYFDASGEGVLMEVDLARETARSVARGMPPEPLRVPGKGWTGMAWTGTVGQADLVVCGFNALYRLAPPDFRLTGVLHQPCMNDLHHVACDGERLLVANTGLDSVEVYSLGGAYLGGYRTQPDWLAATRLGGHTPARADWGALLAPGWSGTTPDPRFETPSGAYYTEPAGTAPFHRRVVRDFVHPNHVAVVGSQVLVTRLQDRAVVDVAALCPVVTDTPGHPHDGELDGDVFWITCVDGLIVGYAVEGGRVTGREVRRLDVAALTGRRGWCRGLRATPEYLVVGLTELRHPPRYEWRGGALAGTETAVLCLDKRSGRLVARVDLGDRVRHSKLFDLEGAL